MRYYNMIITFDSFLFLDTTFMCWGSITENHNHWKGSQIWAAVAYKKNSKLNIIDLLEKHRK
jgi:hypothetical protein